MSYHEQMPGNLSGFFVFRIEKYLEIIKGKTGFSLGVSDIINNFTLNNVSEQARNSSIKADWWWISGFSKGPGFETRIVGGWNRSGKGNVMEAVWRMGWSQKVQWQFNKKLFSSLIWSGAQLGFRKYFHGLDFFIQRKIGVHWTAFIRGNNMLNVRKIGEKMVQPYSISYTDFRLVGRYVLVGFNFQQ